MYSIEIKQIKGKLQLKIDQKQQDGNFVHELTTTNNVYTREFIRAIRSHLKKVDFVDDDLHIVVDDDHSEICIENWHDIKGNEYLITLDNAIQKFLKKQNRMKKIRNLAVSASIAFLGFTGFSLKGQIKDVISPIIPEVSKEESISPEEVAPVVNKVQEKLEEIQEEELERAEKERREEEERKAKEEEEKEQAKLEELAQAEARTNAIYSQVPDFGEKIDDGKIEYVQEHYEDTINELAQEYSIDSRILQCLFAQEAMRHVPEVNANGAIGISQIQYNWHVNHRHTLYKADGTIESFVATDAVLRDLTGNMKTGISIFQNALITFKGNLFLALQAYNYGEGAVEHCVRQTATATGQTVDEIVSNPYNLSWLDAVKNYKGGHYGDPNFLENVLSRFDRNEIMSLCESLENSVWRDGNLETNIGWVYNEETGWRMAGEGTDIELPDDAYRITIKSF